MELLTLLVELELLFELLTFLVAFELLFSLLTLRLELVFELLTLREAERLTSFETLRLELVLLGRSYVLPDWTDLEELAAACDVFVRLEVAGATLLTDSEPPDRETLRFDDSVTFLREDSLFSFIDLDCDALAVERLTLRFEFSPVYETLSDDDLRLKLRSHPSLFI